MTTTLNSTRALIHDLEQARFQALLSKDFHTFENLCHTDLVYSHSNGERDTLGSYIEKCLAGKYLYRKIEHPISQIVVVGDVALVVGEMRAKLDIDGVPTTLDNTSLAVWVRTAESEWKFIAFQPTKK